MNYSQVALWREPTWAVISNQKYPTDHSSDNALLFTATYILLCDEPETEKEMFSKFVDACQVQPGLYNRFPGCKDTEGWDDLIGVAAASVRLGLNYHHEILAWGEKHNWTWDNVNPDSPSLSSFLGRYPTFLPFLQMACGQTPTPADELLYIGGNEASALTPVGNESGKCLQYLMNRSVFGKRPEIDLSIWLWRELMKAKYPAGLSDLYSHYFGASHPFALFSPRNFEAS